MALATTTIIIGGATAGVLSLTVKNRKRLPLRRSRLMDMLHVTTVEEDNNGAEVSKRISQSVLEDADDLYQAIFQNYIDPWLRGERDREATDLYLQQQSIENLKAEKSINQHLGSSILSVALAGAGWLVFTPLLGLSVALSVYNSGHFVPKAYRHLVKERRITEEVMVVVSWGISLAAGLVFANAVTEMLYFAGEKLLLTTESRARTRMVQMWSQMPQIVWVREEDEIVERPIGSITHSDVVVVPAGQMVPVDGVVVAGNALVDQRMLTGEAQPSEKQPGDVVYAATLVFAGTIDIHVQKTGADTVALQITDILNKTISYDAQVHSSARQWADRWASVSIGAGALALLAAGPIRAAAVLNVGLGEVARISAPIAVLNYLNLAMQSDVLIKDGRSLDLLAGVDTIVFDKTGTLTMEQPTLGTIHMFGSFSERALLTYAAAAEHYQTHPIALAILDAAAEAGIELPPLEDVQYDIGYGVRVTVNGVHVQIGSRRYITMSGITLPEETQGIQDHCDANGYSLVYLALDGVLAGVLELRPTLRPEATAVVDALRERGYEMFIISGDQEQPTRKLAEEVGIEHYFANTLPENKAALVKQLQQEGRSVCFVGDGINDGIALKTAQVSISMRGASTVATDAAQILLISQHLEALPELFDLARTYRGNQRVGYMTTVLPGLTFITGVFTLGFGIGAALVVYNLSLLSSVAVAMAPARHLRKEPPQLPAGDGQTEDKVLSDAERIPDADPV